jgi:hypothetical protein
VIIRDYPGRAAYESRVELLQTLAANSGVLSEAGHVPRVAASNHLAGPAGQDRVMSLPASQQRALSQIEKTLAADHPGLPALFDIFTGLAGQEAMPVTERVTTRPSRLPWRRIWPTAAGVVGLALVTVTLFALSLTLPNRPSCTGTVVSIAARMQPVPTGSQGACATQQSEPGKTGPATAGTTRAKSGG